MDTHHEPHELVVPPADVLAFFVRYQRSLMGWKQDTLAGQAGVSLSTIQRVERGNPVSVGALEKIGLALGHPAGALTAPRARVPEAEALKIVLDGISWLTDTVPVDVAPLRKEPQLRSILDCTAALLDSNLGPDAEDDLATLREWMDFASWMAATADGLITPRPGRSFKKRELYTDIFRHIADMERRHRAVCLVGSYEATSNVELFKSLTVGVVAFKSRAGNPSAAKITELRAPPFIDLKKTLRDWLGGED